MDNAGKLKAVSIGAEKHGVNAFSQNEIEHFECCDDDVITSGEVSEEDIMALVNEKKQLYCRFVFRYGGRTRRTMTFNCRCKNALNNFFVTENIDEQVVEPLKIVDNKPEGVVSPKLSRILSKWRFVKISSSNFF
ncbi:hypothetical protein AVEN_267073-1 [Araneus ventricosus]|uniref:Uncharacterized protein n=1 Tax=Araneus ventricosus TaxID=182803 RepID=A0A4Y2IPJ4_ARAVE|nr:hypothetical protein AVEN_267073-1 [Araneus ventricosus]